MWAGRIKGFTRGAMLAALCMAACPTLADGDKSGVKPQVISLPSGPGSIEGLGESFEPQLNSGTVSYSIKLKPLPGRAGFQPNLSVSYNGGSPNSILGLGWQLAAPKIQRQTDKGLPDYDAQDTFVTSDGNELLPVGNDVYRAEIESGFNRYLRTAEGWEVTDSSGVKYIYGGSDSFKLVSGVKEFAWLLQEQVDLNGNRINFVYQSLDQSAQKYLHTITYNVNGDFQQQILFNYESRPDKLSDYRPTFALTTAYRLNNVEMRSTGRLIRRYRFAYDSQSAVSLLTSIQEVGSDDQSTLPPVEFAYSDSSINPVGSNPEAINHAFIQTMAQGDGIRLSANANITFNDMNADGLPDLLVAEASDHQVYPNLGQAADGSHNWGAAISLPTSPSFSLNLAGASLADIDADGKSDFIVQQANLDYLLFKNNGDNSWQSEQVFTDSTALPFDFENPAVRLVDINNDKYIDVMYSNDYNGDLYSYYLNNEGGGYSQLLQKAGLGGGMAFDTSKPEMTMADMNGDRLQDIVLINDGALYYWPNMGNGDWDLTQTGNWSNGEVGSGVKMFQSPDSALHQEASLQYDFAKIKLLDVNGDGLTDALYQPDYADYLLVWLNQDSLTFAAAIKIENLPVADDLTTLLTADMNGNGTTDLVWNYSEEASITVSKTWQYLELYPSQKPYLLTSVTNGIGKTTNFEYGSSTDEFLRDSGTAAAWDNRVPNPINILKRLVVDDGLRSYQTDFDYHNGYYDSVDKEFRGFERAEQIEQGDLSAPALVSAYLFNTGDTDKSLKGKPVTLSMQGLTGEVFYQDDYQWDSVELLSSTADPSQKVLFARQLERKRTVIEKGVGTPVELLWQYEYDSYGNQTKVTEYGRLDAGWDDERVTETIYSASYADGLANWILSKPVEVTVSDENGVQASGARYYYDDSSVLGQVSLANKTREDQWVAAGQWLSSVRNDYDTHGNVIAIYDGLYGSEAGHYRQINYDAEHYTFPVEEIIYTGSTVSSLTTTASYDAGYGKPVLSTDFNGHSTSYAYDAFGRIIAVVKPGDSQSSPTTEFDYVLAHTLPSGQSINWTETRQRENAGGGTVDSRSFYDGLSRKIMTRSEGETAGQIVVSDTQQFNARQLTHKKYLPYFETGSLAFVDPTYNSGFMESTYDALGRVVTISQPDGSYSQTSYSPLIRLVQDEEQTKIGGAHSDAAMRYEEDGLQDKDNKGRLRRVTEIMSASDEWLTLYDYDLLGNLLSTIDSQGNQKIMAYDGLSRRTFMNDPDRGVMNYSYDLASNLIKTVDAKSQTIQMTYDGGNRVLAEYYIDTVIDQETLADVNYHYDLGQGTISQGEFAITNSAQSIAQRILNGTSNPLGYDLNSDGLLDVADVVFASRQPPQQGVVNGINTLGQMAWVEDTAGAEHYSYDERGRKSWVVRTINDDAGSAHNYYTGFDYDSMDRVRKITYPDLSSVDYSYNRRGLLASIPQVIEQFTYNPAGQNLSLHYANGVGVTYDYDNRLRLNSISAVRNGDNLQLQDLNYSYDNVSNIIGITDGRSNQTLDNIGSEINLSSDQARQYNATQSFLYDNLYRLSHAQNDSVYGTINYSYDQIGNMTNKTSNLLVSDPLMDLGTMSHGGVSGASNRIGRGAGDAPGPHAITGTQKGGGDGSQAMSVAYDNNGNTVSERGQSYSWDQKDRLVQMDKDGIKANYNYSFGDSRKYKVVKNSSDQIIDQVFYIDKFSEVRNGQFTKYLYAGNQRAARIQDNGGAPQTFYLHDHLGSTNLALDSAANVTEHLVNYPFGRSRLDGSASKQSEYRFTGKEKDGESELQYFEARYLGVNGKFLSVDPLMKQIPAEWLKTPIKLNSYSYSANNPQTYQDLSGNDFEHFSNMVNGAGLVVYGAVRSTVVAATATVLHTGVATLQTAASTLTMTGGLIKATADALDIKKRVGRAMDETYDSISGVKSENSADALDSTSNTLYGEVLNKAKDEIFGQWRQVAITGLTHVVKGTQAESEGMELMKKGFDFDEVKSEKSQESTGEEAYFD